jgi:hypothetical protein
VTDRVVAWRRCDVEGWLRTRWNEKGRDISTAKSKPALMPAEPVMDRERGTHTSEQRTTKQAKAVRSTVHRTVHRENSQLELLLQVLD